MGLDGLGSSAYGPEAALTILIPLGAEGLHLMRPIMAGILVLLALLYFSYRQTIEAYPSNGGSLTAPKAKPRADAWVLPCSGVGEHYMLPRAVAVLLRIRAPVL